MLWLIGYNSYKVHLLQQFEIIFIQKAHRALIENIVWGNWLMNHQYMPVMLKKVRTRQIFYVVSA